MDNNYSDNKIYPYRYSDYLKNPYLYSKHVTPYGNLLITTIREAYNHYSDAFILRIDDITSGTPKQIVSKTGSFWMKYNNPDSIIYMTLDGTELLINFMDHWDHYVKISDDEQIQGPVNDGKDH